jgi:FdrA protein
VVLFLGADTKSLASGNIHGARTLEDAARAAVALAQGRESVPMDANVPLPAGLPKLAPGQQYIRGLFSGGTFCLEAAMLLQDSMAVRSNTKVGNSLALEDMFRSEGHTVVDLGDDAFTRGRPHPMIDYRLRNERILQEAADPETAVLLIDVVLGFGANADPAAELAPALAAAGETARTGGRGLICIGHICGTDRDPQGLASQRKALQGAGVMLADSNAHAARLARAIVRRIAA